MSEIRREKKAENYGLEKASEKMESTNTSIRTCSASGGLSTAGR